MTLPVVAVARSVLVLPFALLSSPVISVAMEDVVFAGWTCDELTPELCELEEEAGGVQVRGGIEVRYWRYSKATKDREGTPHGAAAPSLLPIVALHGGPSWPHGYMLPLKQQACRGRDIIFYDQAGCGKSVLPKGTNASDFPWLLDPAYYSEEELPAVLSHLSLDRYHILGSSWGTMLAQLFALNAKPGESLASLTLSGPLSDAQLYIRSQWDEDQGNLGSLPLFVQERIHELESKQDYGSAEYGAIDEVLTTFFTLRTAPAPDCFVESAAEVNKDIYVGMQGASEFTFGGVLSSFNTTPRLGELTMPVLLSSGRFDTMRPSVVDVMQKEIKRSERVVFRRSGHVSMIDEPGPMNDAVADFLDRVELAQLEGTEFVPKVWASEGGLAKGSGMQCHRYPSRVPHSVLSIGIVVAFAFIFGVLAGNWRGWTNSRHASYEAV